MKHRAVSLANLLPDGAVLSSARGRLFATALVLFGERGYHGVSVRDITDALGQKPGAIYAHVQSKQDLLFELVRIGHLEHRDRLRAAHLNADSDPVAQITSIAAAHVLVHLEFPALARVTNGEFKFLAKEQVAVVRGIRADSESILHDAIKRGVQIGDFTVVDTLLAVAAIGSMGIRAAEWWRPESGITPQHIAETYTRFAVNLLR